MERGIMQVENQSWTPKEKGFDHTLGVMREGYMYIPNRMQSFQTDIFKTRLLGEQVICLSGKEAAELFYDIDKFKRHKAAPKKAMKTLFGQGGLQTLDGVKHQHRKEMFMSLMSNERLNKLKAITEKHWEQALHAWTGKGKIQLYDEAKEMMTRIASEWAGLPAPDDKFEEHVKKVSSLFESPTKLGLKYKKAVNHRKELEQWIRGLITQVRDGKMHPETGSALDVISWHRDLNENLLDSQTAAVEIVNILRPIVAISIYINFTALAVYQFPNETVKLVSGNEQLMQQFVQEVRRFYPFFPFLPARVKQDFTWKNHTFPKGTLTLLDLYGTNHDPKYWDNPNLFKPDRFADWSGSPFDFIPQGGGDYWMGHRCPGEWMTVDVMKVALDYLVNKMDYTVPKQDLSYRLVHMPSIPPSHVILENIQRK
ncbi:cytochrome P450 [Virgibacillus alimentarius]|uniref:Fatty-acid peroxygenase n=1 Tax=Virgibacillus alimentarius TaxID=698769 RepID=A0ABS4SBH2_9BACI|nr:cytochrome P450 [Virgibacillus alimentarius]MBP2257737.1 fatty-acid peroxygenase [Virgibacillus alimentarius]